LTGKKGKKKRTTQPRHRTKDKVGGEGEPASAENPWGKISENRGERKQIAVEVIAPGTTNETDYETPQKSDKRDGGRGH